MNQAETIVIPLELAWALFAALTGIVQEHEGEGIIGPTRATALKEQLSTLMVCWASTGKYLLTARATGIALTFRPGHGTAASIHWNLTGGRQ